MCIAGHATRLEHHDFRSVRDEDKRSTVSSLAAVPITVGFRWVGRQFASSRSSGHGWNRKTQVRTTAQALPATLSPTDRDFGSLRARALLNYGGFLRCRIKVLYRMGISLLSSTLSLVCSKKTPRYVPSGRYDIFWIKWGGHLKRVILFLQGLWKLSHFEFCE